MNPTVYDYADPRSFLRDVLAAKQRQNPLFSIRAWSKQLGFRCHSSMVLFLNGKRKIRPEHLERLSKGLKLEAGENDYLRALVQFNCAANDTERSHYESQMRVLKPTRETSLLEVEKFKTVADWIHMAILEMTKLADFQSTAPWIAFRLGSKVPVRQVEEAIARLVKLGLLEWKDDRLVKTNERLTTPKDRASESVREHHKQVLAQAIQAIDEQDIEERFVNSCTMTIDSKRLPEAKELMRRFRTEMAKLMEKSEGDETYQMSMQFFRLTKKGGLQ